MRTFLLILLVIGATEAYQLKQNKSTPIEIVRNITLGFQGFFTGLNVDKDLGNITNCLTLTIPAINKIKDFIDSLDFKNLTVPNILKMLSKFCGALKEVFTLLKPCAKVKDDVKTLIEKIKKINVEKLINGLLLKSIRLYGYISEAIITLREKRYQGFGENLGRATHLVLFEKTSFSDS